MSLSKLPRIESSSQMYVTKRNKALEVMSFDKILRRIKKMGEDANLTEINYTQLTMKIIDQLYDKIPTVKIDELTAEQCASLSSVHPDYNVLAGRVLISNHQKSTNKSFYTTMKMLYQYRDLHKKHCPLISLELWEFVSKHKDWCDKLCDYSRDFLIDFFGFKTLERSYLMRVDRVIVERPQHMWLRVSIGIHGTSDIESSSKLDLIAETYTMMSQKWFTHATPTLFQAGTPNAQLASCYLVAIATDSIDGIFDTVKECAQISKLAGGIGIHVHNIRAAGSLIRGSNGTSSGLGPMLKVFNSTAKYCDQGSKRAGSFAIYLETWHADMEAFLELRKNHGDENTKARDLFYALWVSDLFMERIKTGGDWTLMCPDKCPGLPDVYGDEFVDLYTKYESEGRGNRVVKARDLWFQILDAQMETGTPYILYKDAVNRKSNQKNVGMIKSSNLCSEIVLYTDDKETAVCNLASIALPSCVLVCPTKGVPIFDYDKLHTITKVVTYNLNRVIDRNYYPNEKARRSNFRHRPIGIGVQGLADTFLLLNIAYTSPEAKKINKLIFETMYHAAVEKSMEIAKLEGAYETFQGSPASQGIFQFDMWDVIPTPGRYDWDQLKRDVVQYGMRNSMLLALMPTASTSNILGYTECFEPITSNIYARQTSSGQFIMCNRYMIRDLIDLGVWTQELKNNIVQNNGSVQQLDFLPPHIREKYKTVWEISMKDVLDMSADRGAYICQSQSLNIFMEDPTYNSLTSMHFYGWNKKLKTGSYYLRRKAKHKAQQFTIEPTLDTTTNCSASTNLANVLLEDEEGCLMCGA